MRRSSLTVTLAAGLLLPSSFAEAQTITPPKNERVPSVDVRGFDAPLDPKSGLYYEPAASPEENLDWHMALWTSYAYRPVTLRDAEGDVAFDVVQHRVAANFVAGVGILGRGMFGIDLPFVPFQTGDEPTDQATNTLGAYELPTSALGDVKLMGKFTIVPPTNDEFGGFALAVHERLGLPTGDPESYLGEGTVTSETRLLAEYRYLALSVHAALGVELRGDWERYGCAGLSNGDCPTRIGHTIPGGVSLVFLPQSIGLDDTGNSAWFLEAYGYLPLAPEAPFSDARLSAAQVGGGARTGLPFDLYLMTAVDFATVTGIGNPIVRGHLGLGWAPRVRDGDKDGIPDDQDLCPDGDLKEDYDGYQDTDGCPEYDNDDDGVPDTQDACPGEVEDEDGYRDDDGCIDPDNDGDRVLDGVDRCPLEPGLASADPAQNGCPDPDGDGLLGAADLCPATKGEPGASKAGCPNPDDDGDGILDEVDDCPAVAGIASGDPGANGCPDADGDGVVDAFDECPDGEPIPAPDVRPGQGVPLPPRGCRFAAPKN